MTGIAVYTSELMIFGLSLQWGLPLEKVTYEVIVTGPYRKNHRHEESTSGGPVGYAKNRTVPISSIVAESQSPYKSGQFARHILRMSGNKDS